MARLVQSDNRKKQTDNQIGCMSGFLQIFDRQQVMSGKRIHSSKRLPPIIGVGESRETVSPVDSREISRELKKPEPLQMTVVPTPNADHRHSSTTENINHRGNSPMVKTYTNEMPRFSLDSERSPSVVARLMGLETFSSSDQKVIKSAAKPELTRSHSESRVSRDLIRPKYIDRNNFQVKVPSLLQKRNEESNAKIDSSISLFDSAYFYPKTKNQKVVLVKPDFEKKSKMNQSMEQHNPDLTTLRQILEVLQLKGLLHSSKKRESLRTFVFDRHPPSNNRKFGPDDRVTRSPMQDGRKILPTRVESNLKSCNSIVKRKPLSIEIRRRANESFERNSSINSPKLSPKRTGSVHHSVNDRSPRNYKQTESVSVNSRKKKIIKNVVREEESSSISISESIFSTPTTDLEKSKGSGYKDGKSLLQRCDKLLPSKSEMNMNRGTESPPSSTTVLPSPVSVLDSGFDKDDLSSPSNSIDLKATSTVDFEDDTSSIHSISPGILYPTQLDEEEFASNKPELMYISKILQASQHLNIDSNIFNSVENQLYDNETTPNVAKRERKLIFDAIVEILNRNNDLPPWKAVNGDSSTSLKRVWSEYQKTRDTNSGDHEIKDLVSVVLRKDLVAASGWGDWPGEMSEAVLDVERMIFKDLVSEAIGDFVELSRKRVCSRVQRRLVF